MAEERYLCNSCGGILVFDPKSQHLKCPHCDTVVAIESQRTVMENSLQGNKPKTILPDEKKSISMECKSCGANLEVPSNITASRCPYCGESIVMAQRQEEWIIPDGVCPFAISHAKAGEIFQRWIATRRMAPGALKNLYQQGKWMGIYTPSWTFDARGTAPYSAEGGKYRTEHYKDSEGKDQSRRVTDWYHVSGRVESRFDDILISASTSVSTLDLRILGGFKTQEAKPYEPSYMAGYSAERYSVSLEKAHGEARAKMQEELTRLAEDDVRKSYDEMRSLVLSSSFSQETWKHVLLPIYSTAYAFNGKTYQVRINGETGAIDGEAPTSWQKVVLVIVAIVAVIAVIVYALNR